MEEIWKNIKGYDGKYQVSNKGNVRSTNYNNTGKTKLLKLKLNRYGYYQVYLSKNNIKKGFMVGRLVAEAFIPNPQNKPKVLHIGEVTNNNVENLMWAYESEAMHHFYNKRARKGRPSFTRITYNGKNYNKYTDIAKDVGIKDRTFRKRMELGWNLYECLEIPVGKWSLENENKM